VRDFRPTWNYFKNYNDSHENVTANYYPINSAISMRDVFSDRQFTVMNDRSQGGSSRREGQVEFMQNRRLARDDGRGVDDPLDEKDELNHPIRVAATYYLQIFNQTAHKSV